MLKLNEIVDQNQNQNQKIAVRQTTSTSISTSSISVSPSTSPSPSHPSERKTSSKAVVDSEDTEFIQTIINIYNNRINKNNSKYYNILYKTSMADKKRGKKKKRQKKKHFF